MTNPRSRTHKPRLRILFGAATELGPGKTNLIQAIAETGSISAAARKMGMSYRRAWNLVTDINSGFAKPLILTNPGGRGGGGATVTKFGREVVDHYRRIEAKALASIEPELREFSRYLADRLG